jgi:hypothetical protein
VRGDEPLDRAVRAHTNLNTFACVKALMESGTVYGGVSSDAAAAKVIKTCDVEIQRLLKVYDGAVLQLKRKGQSDKV